ncbi:MAG: ABC transporter permease [Candidatus Hadarchaeum sp.]|uniref:ABC transporter permease n=1 Tax=Candidatus Hadarchaeum sp. TaxID=2883567 RepID=UPI0031708404
MLRTFLKRKTALLGIILLTIFAVNAGFAPIISPYNPKTIDSSKRLRGPDRSHMFGTDMFGRDVLSRILWGARLSLIIGFSVSLSTALAGILIGCIAGYFRRTGETIMRLNDILMAFPDIMLALAFGSVFRSQGLPKVILALGCAYLPRMIRTVYSLTLKIATLPYIEAALAYGASHIRILLRHLIPNVMSAVIVQASFVTAWAILAAASLDFLGVGLSPEIPSWGGMINEGRLYISIAPWIVVFPGMCIGMLALALNFIGDGLRDGLDPRLRRLL